MNGNGIVDAHLHISETGKWISDGYDASLSRLTAEMEKVGIRYGVILSLSSLDQNDFVEKVCRDSGGKLFALAGYNPQRDSLEQIIPYLNKKGIFKGIKLHPRRDNFSPHDERLTPLYEEISRRGAVINFDAMAHTSHLPMDEIRPSSFDKLAKRFPDLKMILSHSCVPWVMEAFFTAKSNKNVFLDCSFIMDKFKNSSVFTDLLYTAEHLDRKLIYGSDFPERSISGYLSFAMESFGKLSEEKRSNIFSRNAINLFELE
ncbi:MAG: amidohydrolase [Nitrospinota bacterium]|nr:amidohydrolase [Nitrospinota bacterium]